jgi:hypothetical protein
VAHAGRATTAHRSARVRREAGGNDRTIDHDATKDRRTSASRNRGCASRA